ncbi:MAG TPA: hypothetical protein GXZ91_03430 [Christensenellaceae bacterium]|nr:hypothetical protein [Christensenellaceae bacterium]
MDDSHHSLLIRTARLYYESGLTQSRIAKRLQISRSYVSKLLFEAKKLGIVKVYVHDPMNNENRLEKEIRQRFGLEKVVVAELSLSDNAAGVVAKRASQWLDTILSDGDTVALGWGRTMYLMTQNMRKRKDLKDISVVSLYGMQSIMHENVYNIEGLTNMTEALGASTCYALTVPVFLSDESLKKKILEEKSLLKVFNKLRSANIAVFTVGIPRRSTFLGGYGGLEQGELDALLSKDATSEVCLHVLNREGQVCSENIEKRTVTLPIEELKKKQFRIAVAAGRPKTDAVFSALKSGIANVLIIDEDIAKEIVAWRE